MEVHASPAIEAKQAESPAIGPDAGPGGGALPGPAFVAVSGGLGPGVGLGRGLGSGPPDIADVLRRHSIAPTPTAPPAAPETRSTTGGVHPVIRRKVKLTAQKDIPPDTEIDSLDKLGPLLPKLDESVMRAIVDYLKSDKVATFATVDDLVKAAKARAEISPFVLKSEESRPDAPSGARETSASHHYDFRNNPKAELPSPAPNPVETKPRKAKPTDEPTYLYHVTSYTNLRGIFENGLNPTAGGKIGGSSYHNADTKMNADSAKDSGGKVFVATVGKLTQRYLSFRLRQDDLFKKHADTIIDTLAEQTPLNKAGAGHILAQISMGEEPVVLRFTNIWAQKDWVKDPIDTSAFALQGQPVRPDHIECLTIEGWAKLDTLKEILLVLGSGNAFEKIRSALLTFYGKHNKQLEKWSSQEGAYFIPKELISELRAADIPTKDAPRKIEREKGDADGKAEKPEKNDGKTEKPETPEIPARTVKSTAKAKTEKADKDKTDS